MNLRAHLGRFRLRLTDLSQRNRALRHVRLSAYRDADLMAFSFLEGEGAPALLERILQGKRTPLMRGLKANHPDFAPLDTRLSRIFRELRLIFEENGTYDLYLGYPYVEGRFADGTVARAPLALFPVRLVRQDDGQRWLLESRENTDNVLNDVFLRAFEKYNRITLPPSTWEDDFGAHFPDVQTFLNSLYAQLTQLGLSLEFPSELFHHPLAPFREYRADYLALQPEGVLRVTGHAVLGLFPQSDSALLEDYRIMEERISEFEQTGLFTQAPDSNTPPPPETDRYFGLPIDQDQEDAILALRQGHNIVVYGPPGTGKSQFIVNTVMDYVARGKRVLVASQKRAALDVVYERLVEAHLGQFAYLIHDHRTDRAAVYRQLAQMLDRVDRLEGEMAHLNMAQWQEDLRQIASRIDATVAEDDQRTQVMTQPQPCGLSVWELYAFTAERDEQDLPNLGTAALQLNRYGLDALVEVLHELRGIPAVWDATHPWHNRLSLNNLSLDDKAAWLSDLHRLPELATEARLLRQQLSDGQNLWWNNLPEFKTKLMVREKELEVFEKDAALREAYQAWATGGFDTKGHIQELDSLNDIADSFNSLRWIRMEDDPPLAEWQRRIEYYRAGRKRIFRWLDSRWRMDRKWLKAYIESQGQVYSPATTESFRAECEQVRGALHRAGHPHFQLFWAELPPSQRFTEWRAYLEQRRQLLLQLEATRQATFYPNHWPISGEGLGGWNRMAQKIKQLKDVYLSYLNIIQYLNTRLEIAQQHSFWAEVETEGQGRKGLSQLTDTFAIDFHNLQAADRALARLAPAGLAVFNILKDKPFAQSEHWETKLRLAFHKQWLAEAERNHPILSLITGGHYTTRLDVFRTQLLRKQAQTRDVLYFTLRSRLLEARDLNRLGNATNFREITHQVTKKRLVWPIRKLMSKYWQNGLSELMPCILASPETLSALFPMEEGIFDLVIFDEASQCPVERALPTLMRGKQVAVAGDEKQLPPSDLFAARAEESDNELDEIGVEAESLLHLGRQYFRQQFLGWHYRSRSQALIEFSNQRFYEGRLKSVPTPIPDTAFEPVLEYKLVSGKWESNQNVIEAETIVDELISLIKHPEKPTIGVVTFNQPQQEAIWVALERRHKTLMIKGERDTLAQLQQALTREHYQKFEGIFVKNIENVQGDERDVILFSVGYAPDKDGKVRAQFGLLNQTGGENRLNVAVTRARRKVIVVASLRPEQLNVDHTLNAGPRVLRDYLQYVWRYGAKPGNLHTNSTGIERNRILNSLSARLKREGIPHSFQMGNASFNLDLALLSIENQSNVKIGVQIEGPMYYTGRSAKERLAYRPMALATRGWVVYTVYARNWWLDADGEFQRIINLYNKQL